MAFFRNLRASRASTKASSRVLTCPICEAVGLDGRGAEAAGVEPTFEVRGHDQGKPIRKCLACGGGFLIVGRGAEAIPGERWEEMERQGARFMPLLASMNTARELAALLREAGVPGSQEDVAAEVLAYCVGHNIEVDEFEMMYRLGVTPVPMPLTSGGLPLLPWRVIQCKLELRYGIGPGAKWRQDAEDQLVRDMTDARLGAVDEDLTRLYRQLTEPELLRAYEQETDPGVLERCRRLTALASATA